MNVSDYLSYLSFGLSQLTVEKAYKSDHLASDLDLIFMKESGGKSHFNQS